MGLNLQNLELVRCLMVEEIEADDAAKRLYLSDRLSSGGLADYPELLKQAAKSGSDATLAAQLRATERLRATEIRRKPSGGTTTAAVPITAADTLAEGEFNRFYLRALCRYAIEHSIPQLVIYRAKHVQNARSASEAKIGTRVDPQSLLEDLQRNIGLDTILGLPAGPNSGLSARLP